jgi:nucleotide-binding universal stress UspA family protein
MFDALVFPTDGTDGSLAALPHAIDLAERYGATLHALYVADGNDRTHRDGAVRRGEEAVVAVAERARETGVATAAAVREGEPAETILAYVADVDAGHVVMATRGKRGVDRYVLGSVTEAVVRRSPVPVTTVRTDAVD